MTWACWCLQDPPKSGVVDTIALLRKLGVSLKSGDGDPATGGAHGRQVGLAIPRLLTRSDFARHDRRRASPGPTK